MANSVVGESNTKEEGLRTGTLLNKELTKSNIYQLIRGAPSRITYRENDNPNSKSEVWGKFKIICVDNSAVDFVKCNDCISVFQWTSKAGTGTLNKHKCNFPQAKLSATNASQLQITQVLPKKAPPSAVNLLNDAIVTGLAKDLRPLRTVDSRGYQGLGQALITFGAKYGNQKFSDVVKCHKAIKDSHLVKLANEERTRVKNMLSMAPSYPYFSFTFDLWTENKRQRHFLSLTCHFIDNEFRLQSKLLGAQEFPSEKRKTTLNIREECSKLLSIYFEETTIATILSQSIAVTDGGSNVVGVFSSRLPCMCHKLNLILDHTFADKNLEKHTDIKGALSTIKSVVTYFKRSGLNSKLKCTLKQSVPTRWNSQITMMESYKKSSAEVQELLLENRQLNRLVGLNEDLLGEFVQLLKPFQDASNLFSAEKNVTIDKIVPNHYLLQKHLEENETDSQALRKLKSNMKEFFDHYYVLDTVHFAALALNPRFKALKSATDSQRNAAYSYIRHQMTLMPQDTIIVGVSNGPAPAKKPKLDRMEELADSDPEEDDPTLPKDELKSYIESHIRRTSGDSESFDVLGYWRGAIQFPILRKVAFWILGTPASSASDERTFSSTSQIISDRRSQLGGSTVSDLTILHKNL